MLFLYFRQIRLQKEGNTKERVEIIDIAVRLVRLAANGTGRTLHIDLDRPVCVWNELKPELMITKSSFS